MREFFRNFIKNDLKYFEWLSYRITRKSLLISHYQSERLKDSKEFRGTY